MLMCQPGGPWPCGVVGPVLAWDTHPSPLLGARGVPALKALSNLQHHLSFAFILGGEKNPPQNEEKKQKVGCGFGLCFF